MKKFLSIAIPTYNRAFELEQQLSWLSKEIKGFEAECEILILDNCSPDHTQEVIEKWQAPFQNTTYRTVRHPQNMGGVPNIAACIQESQGYYTWTVGDDDPIRDGTLAHVIKTLKATPEATLLFLNCTSWYKPTGMTDPRLWFDPEIPPTVTDGKVIFQRCMEREFGSVIFITSTVYRTKPAVDAIHQWENSIHNWAGPAYWTAYCATQGDVIVTKEEFLQCVTGASGWQQQPAIWLKIHYKDIPEVCLKIKELGYPHDFCRRVMLKNMRDKGQFGNIKILLRAIQKFPVITAAVLSFSLISAALSKVGKTLIKRSIPRSQRCSAKT